MNAPITTPPPIFLPQKNGDDYVGLSVEAVPCGTMTAGHFLLLYHAISHSVKVAGLEFSKPGANYNCFYAVFVFEVPDWRKLAQCLHSTVEALDILPLCTISRHDTFWRRLEGRGNFDLMLKKVGDWTKENFAAMFEFQAAMHQMAIAPETKHLLPDPPSPESGAAGQIP